MAHVLMSLLMIITVLRFSSSPDTSSNPVLDLGFPACGTVRSKCMFKLPGLGYFCFSKEPVLNPCVSTLYAWMITVNIPLVFSSVQFSSVAQSCLTLCDPMNRSTPGLPMHHQLPEFTQTHVHRVGDAIQPSNPLLSPSPPAPYPSQHQRTPRADLL